MPKPITRWPCCWCCGGDTVMPCADVHDNGPHVERCPNGCDDDAGEDVHP